MAAIVGGNYLSRVVAPIVILAVLMCCLTGCSEPASTVDPAPFEAAVADYLTKNDMALRLKAIRQGPTVDGGQATMVRFDDAPRAWRPQRRLDVPVPASQ